MGLLINRHGLIGKRGAHTLGLISGACGIAAGEDDEKLFAAVAAHRVVAAGCALHAAGELAQNGIAGEVAVSVVDHLEVVEIGENDADGTIFAGTPGKLALEDIENRGPVPDAA